ncbi:hypothetical protein RQP46_006321 [Phenoliferia psychrophenolica]
MADVLPPGPSELVASALLATEGPGQGTSESGGVGGGGSALSTADNSRTTSVSGRSTPDSTQDPNPATTTTTITTTENGGQEVTEVTHIGASSVGTQFNKDGSISIKPVAARKGAKVRTTRTHAFTPRISQFDRDNRGYQVNATGFFTLFWIAVFIALVRTGVRQYTEVGVVWGSQFASLISEDAIMLAISDAVMVTSTYLCVPFVKMVNRGWIRYYWTGAVIQHTLQALFLFLAVRWTFHRHWPWVQSGFMTLHSLTLLMKMHSYCSHNGELSEKRLELQTGELLLATRVESAGGSKLVEKEARAAWAKEQRKEAILGGGGVEEAEVRQKDFLSASGGLRRRGGSATDEQMQMQGEDGADKLAVMSWHPEPMIGDLATDLATIKEVLVSTGVKKVEFPANVTWWNFTDYLLVPTLVYQLEYPRTNKIRPMYIVEKTLATFGTFSILVLIVEHYILPVSPSATDNSFLMTALDLAIPFMVNYLLIFYIIFECICNVFAELTMFSDREFYSDWWNSVSFDEFSRRWNVPVHAFLLRHVYSSTISTYKFSKFQAAFTTFLLSAAVHELVMAVVTQKIRFYLFALQVYIRY